MRIVKFEDLKKEIEIHSKLDKYVCVFLWTPGCRHCDNVRSFIEEVEEDNKDLFDWWEVEVDEIPLFLPPALPYICLFWNGFRKWEGSGDPGKNAFVKSMGWWREQLNTWTEHISKHPEVLTQGPPVPKPIPKPV